MGLSTEGQWIVHGIFEGPCIKVQAIMHVQSNSGGQAELTCGGFSEGQEQTTEPAVRVQDNTTAALIVCLLCLHLKQKPND